MFIYLLLLVGLSITSGAGIQLLFPELKQYNYVVKTNVSTGTLSSASSWTLEGRLLVLVYDNFTKVRFKLDGLKTSMYSQSSGFFSHKEDPSNYLEEPWEAEYQENGFINALYVGSEPVWSTNVKRAIALNFQLKKESGSYTNEEACLYDSCVMVYTEHNNIIRKYTSYQKSSQGAQNSWSSVPWENYGRGAPESIATSERVYDLNEKGLNNLDMRGVFQYKVNGHVFSVSSELSLYLDTASPSSGVEKLNVTRTGIQYEAGNFDDWSTGIQTITQAELASMTYKLLLKIARKGIDSYNIERNASLIHSMDFIDLSNLVTRLSYTNLIKLFEDLVLGTSYELETARNIFLEVLPHGRSDACARFIKYLVVEEKKKIEDATIISIIRKLPFNIANLSQSLLEELETFTKLGLDFPAEIRHAGILSFATLVSKAAEVMKVKQDYMDTIVVKYFRMYSDCPQYQDRMVWLQGLCTLGYTADSYIRTIYADKSRNRYERLWSSLACGLESRGYSALETTLPVLLDEEEHIQLRIASLHAILSSGIRESDFLFIHNFITTSSSKELQRFWYTTVKNLETNKFFSRYRTVADFIPFVAQEVKNPDTTYWATNNYIVSNGELGPWIQILSVGAEPAPSLIELSVASGGRRPYQASVYIIAEGISSNLFKKMHKLNRKNVNVNRLVEILEKLKVSSLKSPEKVHIDIVIKIHDKTVFASHVNQSRFDSWNGRDLTMSVMEFLRFGSHINQQMAYYPVQMDVHLPSELGTPIRLQSSIVTFTSVRGNLTAPADTNHALDWENDLHIRYQGTSVTSLSTAAPLSRSLHIVRLQRSIVVQIPIKFNVTMEPTAKAVALTWLNPFAQHAGMAIHSHVQIQTLSNQKSNVYTVETGTADVDDNGIFFDCDRKTSGAEVIEKYIMSKFVSYDILPTQSILNSIQRFTSSPGCGVIIPPSRPTQNEGRDEVIHVSVSLGDIVAFERVDRVEINFDFTLSYYGINEKNQDIFLKIESNSKINCAGRNVSVEWFLYVEQPNVFDPNKKYWKVCYFEQDISHAPADQDLTTHPASYHGHTTLTYHTSNAYQSCYNNDNVSKITMEYSGIPKNVYGNIERYVEFEIKGEKLHQFDLLSVLGLGAGTPVAQLLGSLDKDTINTTAVIQEVDGIASVTVNKGAEIQFESDSFAWLLDSWTAMQLMKRFGVYRECRLQESTVQTLSGNVEQLNQSPCSESLVLADCSETPSFVITRLHDGGINMYDGDRNLYNTTRDIIKNSPILPIAAGLKVQSDATGVVMYKRFNETVILIPSSYMPSVCGECAGDNKYNTC